MRKIGPFILPQDAKVIRAAFPRELESDVNAVLQLMQGSVHGPTRWCIGPVKIDDQWVHIPSRIYSPEVAQDQVARLSPVQRAVLQCIYTRHHDGRVRERSVVPLLSVDQAWVPPFVVQLAGEYVVEIALTMYRNVPSMPIRCYKHFEEANAGFIDLTKQRAISYWDCYYRSDYPRFGGYPAFKFLHALGLWQQRDTKRLKFKDDMQIEWK